MPNILTVTAHPDDEILGFGGSSFKLSQKGYNIHNLILSGDAEARVNRPEIVQLHEHSRQAQQIIGAEPPIFGPFPNIKFNSVPHLDLVQFIEKYIIELEPLYIFTHHPYDLNNDHYHTSKACQAAVRLFQRRKVLPLKGFYFMEIPSSTDWALSPQGHRFTADTFIEIEKVGVEKKILSLSKYEGVMRPYPHPRSHESLESLATYRGSQSGTLYAEAFQTVFQRNTIA